MGKWASIKHTLWNPQAKTCLGRTGDSWLKIIAFYICLYTCLAGIWAAYYGLFHLTINDKSPKWILDESIIGTNPGVGIRPQSPEGRIESALIAYRQDFAGDQESGYKDGYKHWVDDLSGYLRREYEDASVAATATTTTTTTSNQGDTQQPQVKSSCEANKSDEEKRTTFCPFDRSDIPAECTAAQNFSFPAGTPCILLKLNRIYGWQPEPYESKPEGYPDGAEFAPGGIQITCEGQHDHDKEHLGGVKYYPKSNSIDLKYYPFYNQPGYQSPFVMVHFENPRRNTLIYVECKAWAKNIQHDRYNRKGLTTFELFIETPPAASSAEKKPDE